MSVYVWYDVVSMFVNDVVCDRDIVSSGKEILVLRLLRCTLFGDSVYLKRHPDSTVTYDSYRWRIPVSEESKEVHMTMSEVWNMSWSGYDIWINPVNMRTVKLEVWNRNWSGQTVSEVWNMSPIGTAGWYMTGANLWV